MNQKVLICSRCKGTRETSKHHYCNRCKTEYNREYRRHHRDRLRDYYRHYARGKSAHISEVKRLYYEANTDDCKRRAAQWREQNPDRYAALIGKHSAQARAQGCIGEEFNFEATISVYAEARRLSRETGETHHVDHVIPLAQNGCHCACNLQVLKATDHYRKTEKEFVIPAD